MNVYPGSGRAAALQADNECALLFISSRIYYLSSECIVLTAGPITYCFLLLFLTAGPITYDRERNT